MGEILLVVYVVIAFWIVEKRLRRQEAERRDRRPRYAPEEGPSYLYVNPTDLARAMRKA